MITKKIEMHVGRQVDFLDEVVLIDHGNGIEIEEWNIADIEKPDIDEIQKIKIDEEEYNNKIGKKLTLIERVEQLEQRIDQLEKINKQGIIKSGK